MRSSAAAVRSRPGRPEVAEDGGAAAGGRVGPDGGRRRPLPGPGRERVTARRAPDSDVRNEAVDGGWGCVGGGGLARLSLEEGRDRLGPPGPDGAALLADRRLRGRRLARLSLEEGLGPGPPRDAGLLLASLSSWAPIAGGGSYSRPKASRSPPAPPLFPPAAPSAVGLRDRCRISRRQALLSACRRALLRTGG